MMPASFNHRYQSGATLFDGLRNKISEGLHRPFQKGTDLPRKMGLVDERNLNLIH